jgi:hypothetical protein
MLTFLHGHWSYRKRRLFEAACCRRAWSILVAPARQVVEALEAVADGAAVRLKPPGCNLGRSRILYEHQSAAERARVAAELAVDCAAASRVHSCDVRAVTRYLAVAAGELEGLNGKPSPVEFAAQCQLLREIVGTPPRAVVVDAASLAWIEGALRNVARAIYEGRRFSDLPILADAIEEAGCASADLLNHCRGPGPHVLGCWALDFLAGTE